MVFPLRNFLNSYSLGHLISHPAIKLLFFWIFTGFNCIGINQGYVLLLILQRYRSILHPVRLTGSAKVPQ